MSREQNLAVAQAVTLKPIEEIAARLFLPPQYLEPYGRFKAKIALEALSTAPPRQEDRDCHTRAIDGTSVWRKRWRVRGRAFAGVADGGHQPALHWRHP